MRTKFNGKIYDTGTGSLICHSPKGDLYKRYHAIDFFVCDGKNLSPVTFRDASNICRQYGTKETYELYFVPSRSQGRTNINLTMESYSKLRICAQLHGTTLKQELNDIIAKAYRNRDRHKEL